MFNVRCSLGFQGKPAFFMRKSSPGASVLPFMISQCQDPTELLALTDVHQPEDSVGFLLWRVAHRYQREIDRACATVDLTHLQFVALTMSAWLGREGEAVTQPDLCRFSSIHPMQLSNVLKALEEKGLLARPRSEADSRKKHVEVTARGNEILARALPLVQAAQSRFFGADAQASEEMQCALKRLVANWNEDE